MTTKEIKNWEWIKSVEVQYMGFLTQYLGTATDSKGFVELMKQLRLDEAIAYLKDDLGKDSSEPSYYKFQFYTKTMQFTKEEELWEAIDKGSMSGIEQPKESQENPSIIHINIQIILISKKLTTITIK